MKTYTFETTCIEARGKDILAMRDSATKVTYRTMLKHCVDMLHVAQRLGYIVRGQDLKLKDDWCVSYHRSKYRGKPCYYFVWSGIEHIFTRRRTCPHAQSVTGH